MSGQPGRDGGDPSGAPSAPAYEVALGPAQAVQHAPAPGELSRGIRPTGGSALPAAPEDAFAGLPEADSEWRRLSPKMLLIHPIREAARALPALVGILIAGTSSGNGEWWALGATGLVVVLALARWFTTRYRITPDQVQLRTGVIRKKSVATPADRVRTVDVTANVMHRVLGLAKVEIGTARVEKKDQLALDALPKDAAYRLRDELLHRRYAAARRGPAQTSASSVDERGAGERADAVSVDGTAASASSAGEVRVQGRPGTPRLPMPAYGEPERELVAMQPSWIRYAPFTMSGFITALTIFGFGSRIISDAGNRLSQYQAVESTTHRVTSMSLWVTIVIGLVLLLVVIVLLSLGGYVLSFWRFRLSRHEGGSLHVSRGLLTTRATSIEERRLRGVQLVEPILLRAVRGARLMAVSTGLKTKGREDGGSNGALLVPPAPREVVRDVAGEVVRDGQVVSTPLLAHGPAARRRRYTRAVGLTALVVLVVVLAWRPGLPGGPDLPLFVPALAVVILLPLAALLAKDRYAALGHVLTDRFLVCRKGSVVRRTTVLQRDGIIGWNLTQSFFQRRVGVCTLVATTAGGKQSYEAQDLDEHAAVALADAAVPELVRQFLA